MIMSLQEEVRMVVHVGNTLCAQEIGFACACREARQNGCAHSSDHMFKVEYTHNNVVCSTYLSVQLCCVTSTVITCFRRGTMGGAIHLGIVHVT